MGAGAVRFRPWYRRPLSEAPVLSRAIACMIFAAGVMAGLAAAVWEASLPVRWLVAIPTALLVLDQVSTLVRILPSGSGLACRAPSGQASHAQ